LTEENIEKIEKVYKDWEEVEGFSKVISNEEAARNDYNLSPSRYVPTVMKKGKIEESNLLLVRRFKQRLSAITEDAEIILFGSTARGDATESSDIDICIIVPNLDRNIRDIILEISWEVGFEGGKVIAPVIVEKKEIETGLLRFSPFFQTVIKEGVRM